MKIEKNKLIPENGKWLTNDKNVYSKKVWLGIYDSSNNWREVDESEVPADFLITQE